jgi:hypothetical protein
MPSPAPARSHPASKPLIMPVVGVAPRPAHPARVVARVSAVTVAAVLSATQMAQTTEPTPRLRVATTATPIIRLTLGGDISLSTAAEPLIDVSAHVRRRGFTIGSTNASRRGTYTLVAGHAVDTVLIRALPRPARRSIGLSFGSERVTHVVQAPEGAVLLIRSDGGRVVINGARITQCQNGLIVRRPGKTLRCVPDEMAVAHARPRTAFIRSGILKLGTGASEYRLYTLVEPTRLALKP